jgi:hypothetical protein
MDIIKGVTLVYVGVNRITPEFSRRIQIGETARGRRSNLLPLVHFALVGEIYE